MPAGELGERGNSRLDHRAARDFGMAGHGADHQRVPLPRETGQFRDVLQIDDGGGRGEALFHRRQQGHAAGERLGVLLCEGGDGGREGGGAIVFKGVHFGVSE